MAKALALVLLLGCGAPCGLQSARSRWYAATGLRPPISAVWTFVDADSLECGATAAGFVSVGCTRREGWPLRVAIALKNDFCEDTTLHEAGHTLGNFGHSRAGVMTAHHSDGTHLECITPEDLELICAEAPCKWKIAECALDWEKFMR